MPDGQPPTIDLWLAEVRPLFVDLAPTLLPLFDSYAAEAAFGRRYIATDLERLLPGAKILEVGAGSLLLSCQLMREGFAVTALEPVSVGFSHFDEMRRLVLDRARALACCPEIIDQAAEVLAVDQRFDYAFSVNVMEHVGDVALVLKNVGRSMRVGASYRFTCPNYLFPYEPHFDIPTLFSKRLTERLLGEKIFASSRMGDPAGTWQSLNWITVPQVKSYVRRLPGLRLTFNRSMLVSTLERVASDPDFAGRRSPALRRLLTMVVSWRMHHLFGGIPAALQPIMDCRLEKIGESQEN